MQKNFTLSVLNIIQPNKKASTFIPMSTPKEILIINLDWLIYFN